MSTHEQIKERLTNFALRELSEQQSAEVEAHLAECPQCSGELKRGMCRDDERIVG